MDILLAVQENKTLEPGDRIKRQANTTIRNSLERLAP